MEGVGDGGGGEEGGYFRPVFFIHCIATKMTLTSMYCLEWGNFQ